MKCAIVDLGSNTIRMSLYQLEPEGRFDLLFSEKKMAGLANYMEGGVLSSRGIGTACEVLRGFQAILRQLGPIDTRVFATASLRNIKNTNEALARIREETGLEVEVLSGKSEALLGCRGALLGCKLEVGALFDIGGGSCEITRLKKGEAIEAGSLNIGSLNLFNQYVSGLWPGKSEMREIREAARRGLERSDLPDKPVKNLCGIGGTARAVLKIGNQYLDKPDGNRVLTRKELGQVAEMLTDRGNTARRLVLRSCPDRVHTIIPGVILMNELARRLCRERQYISRYGVREGYLCQRLENIGI
ncbi:MAG: phosphatase [Clostridiales bacterium]|nr:phosphatase [Clostridiales bacterium]